MCYDHLVLILVLQLSTVLKPRSN